MKNQGEQHETKLGQASVQNQDSHDDINHNANIHSAQLEEEKSSIIETISNTVEPKQIKVDLVKTCTADMKSGWVYDCIFSQIGCTTSEESGIFGCTKKGRLIYFKKQPSQSGILTNYVTQYESPNEQLFRLALLRKSNILLCGSSTGDIHVFKSILDQEKDDNQDYNKVIQKVHQYSSCLGGNNTGIVYEMLQLKQPNQIVSANTGHFTIYDLQASKIIAKYGQHQQFCTMQYYPNLNILAAAGPQKNIALFDPRSFKQILNLKMHTSSIPRIVKLSNNNQYFLASGSHDRSLIIWDLRNLSKGIELKDYHKNVIFGLAQDSQNQLVFSSSWDKTINVLDLKTMERIAAVNSQHTDNIIACKFNQITNELMTSSRDGTIQIYKSNVSY